MLKNKKKSFISVVIPLYNKARFIKSTIQSVLAQTCQDFEIVVIDDGSTDGSPQIVRTILDSRIRIISQENGGVSVARNRGIKEAQNNLIAFLDADDIWSANFLEEILYLAKTYSEAGAYATACEFFLPNGTRQTARYKNIPKAPWRGILPSYFSAVAGDPPIYTSAVAVRRNAIEEVGGFPIGHHLGEDLDTWARIALRYPIAWSSKICMSYICIDTNSLTAKQGLEKEFVVIGTLETAVQDSPKAKRTELNVALSKYYYISSRIYARTGDIANAKKTAFLSAGRARGRSRIKMFGWLFFLLLPEKIVNEWMQYRTKR